LGDLGISERDKTNSKYKKKIREKSQEVDPKCVIAAPRSSKREAKISRRKKGMKKRSVLSACLGRWKARQLTKEGAFRKEKKTGDGLSLGKVKKGCQLALKGKKENTERRKKKYLQGK